MRALQGREVDGFREADWDEDEAARPSDRGIGRGAYRETAADAYAEPQPPEPHDLTLGMTALLGIFLAVVLVCAVFFGFGYSTGRTLHGAKASSTPGVPTSTSASTVPTGPQGIPDDDVSGPADSAHASAAPPLTAAPSATKPSAGAPLADTIVETPTPSASVSQTAVPGGSAAATNRFAAPSPAAAAGIPAAGSEGVMVQIAAVARQADADMLAKALRSNGYAAIVRTEPQDRFLHVQIGPFATRDQAKAMRTRLQGAGYNAFLKP